MSIEERAAQKFRSSPSPVQFTKEEYLAFCRVYGVVQPNNYEDPFMGKVITIRESEFDTLSPQSFDAAPLEDGDYSDPHATFIAEATQEPDPFMASLIPELDDVAEEEDEEPTDDIIEEDPYA